MKRRKGIFLTDAIVGLGILGMAAGMLGVGMTSHETAMRRLTNHRAAARIAENAISRLQSGGDVPRPADPRSKIRWRKIDGASAPQGMVWMEVDVTVERESERLVGMTPGTVAEGER